MFTIQYNQLIESKRIHTSGRKRMKRLKCVRASTGNSREKIILNMQTKSQTRGLRIKNTHTHTRMISSQFMKKHNNFCNFFIK